MPTARRPLPLAYVYPARPPLPQSTTCWRGLPTNVSNGRHGATSGSLRSLARHRRVGTASGPRPRNSAVARLRSRAEEEVSCPRKSRSRSGLMSARARALKKAKREGPSVSRPGCAKSPRRWVQRKAPRHSTAAECWRSKNEGDIPGEPGQGKPLHVGDLPFPRSHAPAWERTSGRSCGPAKRRTGRRASKTCVPTQERGNESRHGF